MHCGMRIGDIEINGGPRGERYDPADGRHRLHTYAIGTPADVDAAVCAADAAFPAWRDTPVSERVAIIERVLGFATARKDELAAILSVEAGKPTAQAKGEIDKGREILEHAAELGRDPASFRIPITPAPAGFELAAELHPYGVAALITAWNFPWILFLWKAAYALIAGNTIVWKPAEQTPAISLALFNLFKEAGLPPGVFNLIYGGADVGKALVLHPGVEVISMTGSTNAAFQIAELNYGERVKRGLRPCALQCEAGGKNPAFVMKDVSIRSAVGQVVSGAFLSAGQRCTATGLLLVERGCVQEVTAALVEATQALKMGLPTGDGVQVGPFVDKQQMRRVLGFIERARDAGFTIVCGGYRLTLDPFQHGWFVHPTVVTGVTADAEIAQEEIFGPVLPVVEVDDFEAAVAVANGLRYGLKSAIHTNNRNLAQRWIREVRCGGVHINDATAGAIAATPFGGAPNSLSAIGLQECGEDAMRPYQRKVAVFDNLGNVGLSAAR